MEENMEEPEEKLDIESLAGAIAENTDEASAPVSGPAGTGEEPPDKPVDALGEDAGLAAVPDSSVPEPPELTTAGEETGSVAGGMAESAQGQDKAAETVSGPGSIGENPAEEAAGISQNEDSGLAGEASHGQDKALPAEETPAGVPPEAQKPAADEPAPSGDIEDLIKKYEDLPEKAGAAGDNPDQGSGKKKIALPGFLKNRRNLIIAGTSFAVIVVSLTAVKFIQPKKVKTSKVASAGRQPVSGKQISGRTKTAVSPVQASSPNPLMYPGAVPLTDEKSDGIEEKMYETNALLSDIKLFYQKKMAEMGYEINSVSKKGNTHHMKYMKGKDSYNISLIPVKDKKMVRLVRSY